MEDINRIKLVLVERNVQTNGFQNRWELHLPPFRSGVPTRHNQI